MRILLAESLRFPGEGSSTQGKPGPKPRPKGVGDGESVENPMPPSDRLSEGVTQEGRRSARMEECVQARRVQGRQIRLAESLRGDGERILVAKSLNPNCQEKPLARQKGARTANRHR